jgi:thiamine biosynthesis protein ThiS
MRLIINGEESLFGAALTIGDLVSELGLDPRKVAIERNLEIVPKSAYFETSLIDGDRLEIVHFVGGG